MGRGAVAIVASSTLVLAGCDPDEPIDLPGLPPLGKEEPDLDRVREALRDEQALLDRLERVRRRHRSLRRLLAPTVAVHTAHVRLLGRAVDDPGAPGDGSPGVSFPGSSTPVPRSPTGTLAELVVLERSLADRHVETAMRSRSGVLARMVAAMSAAAAQQAVAVGTLDAAPKESRR